jgi:hypothetical protein
MKTYLAILLAIFLTFCLIYFCTLPTIVPLPTKVLVFKTKPSVFSDRPGVDLVFEEDDMNYYTEQPRFLLDYLDFDIENQQVEIPVVDNQNTHDSFVQKTIRNTYATSNLSTDGKNVVKEILKCVDNDPDITKVLETIRNRKATISNLNDKKEMEILEEVWNAVKNDDVLKAYFITQLQDCYENYSTVCPTGVVTRIVSVLSIKTPEKMPRTKELITEEMLNTASKLRNNLENDEVFTKLSDEEQQSSFKRQLISKYQDDYSDFMTSDEITEITSGWINEI